MIEMMSNGYNFYMILNSIPSEELIEFFNSMSSDEFSVLKKEDGFLIFALQLLPIHHRETFLKRFHLNEVITSLLELAEVVGVLPDNQIRVTLASFGVEKLRSLYKPGSEDLGRMWVKLPNEHWEYYSNLLGKEHTNSNG